jgi:hypothetical protein
MGSGVNVYAWRVIHASDETTIDKDGLWAFATRLVSTRLVSTRLVSTRAVRYVATLGESRRHQRFCADQAEWIPMEQQTARKAYTYKLIPTPQEWELGRVLGLRRWLTNTALE